MKLFMKLLRSLIIIPVNKNRNVSLQKFKVFCYIVIILLTWENYFYGIAIDTIDVVTTGLSDDEIDKSFDPPPPDAGFGPRFF